MSKDQGNIKKSVAVKDKSGQRPAKAKKRDRRRKRRVKKSKHKRNKTTKDTAKNKAWREGNKTHDRGRDRETS